VPASKELLDPASWGEVLELYAHAVNLAVALVDGEGRVVGRCHNPQPIWNMAREARPEWGPGCPFCLDASGHCTAAADARRTRSVVLVRGLGGFVHVAAPLFLADPHVGTVVAGQVFDQYPDLLQLERVAKEFGLLGRELWRLARQSIPMSRTNMAAFGNLLYTLGNAFLQERYSTILQRTLAETNVKLQSSNQDLNDANTRLHGKVLELDQANAEKDILLSEVHHRVNNNLQVVASLLRMQAEAFPDGQVAEALRESQLRIDSMALIHAQLYSSVGWRAVDFAEYAAILANNLFRSYGIDQAHITCRLEVASFELGVDKAVPAGLILNELITNALKHAFPEGRHGSILVHGELRDGRIEFDVQDDGVGIRKTIELRRQQPLGLKIVSTLCRQLKGTFVQPDSAEGPSPGSIFRVSFPY
jgi:two-component sensor histidine kinase